MAIEFGLLILGAYLLGSVPAAYLVARWSRGIDIRQHSDGNGGSTNLLRLAPTKWLGLPVIVFDLGKGMLMVWVAGLVGLDAWQQIIVGSAAIVGHNWPVFLRFSGGRGVLTTLGVTLVLFPRVALLSLFIAFCGAPFGFMGLTTLCAVTLLPVWSWFSSLPVINWLFGQPLGINEQLAVTLSFLAIFLVTVIRRITAPRTPFTASVPLGWLFINRLLFDRDIRDRKAWVQRTSPEADLDKH